MDAGLSLCVEAFIVCTLDVCVCICVCLCVYKSSFTIQQLNPEKHFIFHLLITASELPKHQHCQLSLHSYRRW